MILCFLVLTCYLLFHSGCHSEAKPKNLVPTNARSFADAHDDPLVTRGSAGKTVGSCETESLLCRRRSVGCFHAALPTHVCMSPCQLRGDSRWRIRTACCRRCGPPQR